MIVCDAWIDKADFKQFASFKGKIRVAAAIGLTKTAKDAQAALRAEAGGIFHLRNSWVVQGIRIKGANAGSLNAQVGSIDKYMGRHVSGDPKAAGKALSIRGTRDASTGRIASGGLLIGMYAGAGELHRTVRRRLGRIDGQKKKTFQIARGGSVLIVRRRGKDRSSLETLGVLKSNVAERPRWNMEATVGTVVAARFGEHFAAAIAIGKGL